MATDILSQVVFLSGICCHLHLPSLSSFAPQAFVALELKGPLHILCSNVDPSPSNTSMHVTSSSSMDVALITRSSLYNTHNGQSVLNSVKRASYITIKVQWKQKRAQMTINTRCDNCQLLPCLSCPRSCNASVAPATHWFKSMHSTYLLSFSMLMKAM